MSCRVAGSPHFLVSQSEMDYQSMHTEIQGHKPIPPTRLTKLTSIATNVVDPVVNNPSIGTAVQVLESLAEVGKALPFIAPAFILLKVIIDLEKRAQEVDIKCTDLLERITFMLSHLPSLQKINIMSSTKQVIERINDALKESVSLIAAYRKQNRIVRRLAIGNRDKFTTCAKTINNCSRDLLMSLQIHQTVKLDILTRDVPIDDEDKAAQQFVEQHGGNAAVVVRDRELVTEFATQQHLAMDDSVMEQLNSNITELMQQNQTRLEGILRDNVSTAIVDGLKNIAMELNVAEAEQKFKCVQCDKEFTHYTNGPKACSFHRAEYNTNSKQFPCCSNTHPCEFGAHRSKHHCDYPYGNFFPRVKEVAQGYLGTTDVWAKVEDYNLESDVIQKAVVGKLRKWLYHGALIQENILLIMVGTVAYNSPYYFNTFTANDLEIISQSVQHSGRTLIYRTSPDDNEFAMAEWVLSTSREISGVRLSGKSATSYDPWIHVCPIDIKTCTKSGDVVTLSEGGLKSYTPASPYILPENIMIGSMVREKQSRPPRTDFKSKPSPSFPVILKAMSDPPLEGNAKDVNDEIDFFYGKVSIFNNNPPGSLNAVTISGVSASYRLIGDDHYTPANKCSALEGLDAPVTIEPRQSRLLSLRIIVPRNEEDSKLGLLWGGEAFVARHRPIRIKVVVEDIEGRQCSLVMEYVYTPPYRRIEKPRDKDIGFFYFDNPDTFSRHAVHVEPPNNNKFAIIRIGEILLYTTKLDKLVHKALKTGQTEFDLEIGLPTWANWEWVAYALVDISCRRVYAFKVIIREGFKVPVKHFGCKAYIMCPEYGNVVPNTTRPISYATEVATLPPLEPYTIPDYPQDDTFDDIQPSVPLCVQEVPIPPFPITGSLDLDNIRPELASAINTNLARIATALENIVNFLPGLAPAVNNTSTRG